MNIAVVGGRDFNDYKLMEKSLLDYLKKKKIKDVTIVSGGARSNYYTVFLLYRENNDE